MKLSNRAYDFLKWTVMIALPALATAYVGLAAIWSWPYADEVAKTTAVICTLLGALLGISSAQYYKDDALEGLDPVLILNTDEQLDAEDAQPEDPQE